MADDNGTPTPTENPSQDSGDGQIGAFTPVTSQEELNKVIESRLARERAKYSDYDDMKKRLDEIEGANKTELQKLTESHESVKTERDGLAAETARLRAAIKFELSIEDVEALDGVPPDKVEALAERLAQKQTKKPPKPAGLQSGAGPGGPQLTGKERAAAAVRQMRNGR